MPLNTTGNFSKSCIILILTILLFISFEWYENYSIIKSIAPNIYNYSFVKSITPNIYNYSIAKSITPNIYNYSIAKSIGSQNDSITKTIVFKKWNFVYFQHVRKAAGTAIKQLLIDYNKLQYSKFYSSTSDQWMAFDGLKRRAIGSHSQLIPVEYFPFYTYSYLSKKHILWTDILLIMVFRDPLQRIFSDLIYQGTWRCGNLPRVKEKLENFLIDCTHKHHAKFTSNVYSKVLSGTWPYANRNWKLHKKGIDFNPNLVIDRMQYKLAQIMLKEFDITLIIEMWNITKLQLKCNGLLNDTLPHTNLGKKKQKSSLNLDNFPKLKNELIKYNKFDIELYKYAKFLALQNVQKCGENINEYKQYLSYTENINDKPVKNITKEIKEWNLFYVLNTDYYAVQIFQNKPVVKNFTEIKINAIERNISYISNGKRGFHIQSYLKHKREIWNDIKLVAILINPLQQMLTSLYVNRQIWCNITIDLEFEMNELENQLIECVSNKNKYIKLNILCQILSGTYSNDQIIHSIQYETAELMLNEFDIILLLPMSDENTIHRQLKCNNLEYDSLPFVEELNEIKYRLNNVSINHNNLNFPKLKQKLRQLNKHDIGLYENAIQLASDKIQNCVSEE
eukprot:186494_1